MKSFAFLKYSFLAILGLVLLYNCGGSGEVEYEEVAIPTEGLITVVQEVQKDEFKIAEEITVPDTSQSLIIANYLDNTSDTFTLAEVRLMQSSGYSSGRSGSVMQSAMYGYFGYMVARNLMGGSRPRPGAYTSQSAYNKTANGAGSSLNKTANRTRTAKPSKGRSGFGGGKSTRSVGG